MHVTIGQIVLTCLGMVLTTNGLAIKVAAQEAVKPKTTFLAYRQGGVLDGRASCFPAEHFVSCFPWAPANP